MPIQKPAWFTKKVPKVMILGSQSVQTSEPINISHTSKKHPSQTSIKT